MPGTESDPQLESSSLTEPDEDDWQTIEHLGRTLHVKDADLPSTLVAILNEAVSLTDGTEHAGVNLYIGGQFEPQAVLGAAPAPLDALQKSAGAGPCIVSSRDQVVIRIRDIHTSDESAEFIELASSLGVRSILCLPLWVDDTRLGSLSLYSGQVRDFDDRDARIASLLATHAALVLSDALRAQNLRKAIAGRDVIGQAKGILMERQRITAEEAFSRLSKASQNSNRKLADLAAELVETGALPV